MKKKIHAYLSARLTHLWYQPVLRGVTFALLPLSWMFSVVVAVRRFLYKIKLLKTHTFDVPVIVVGNIAVGGTGKTPFVIWLANFLRAQGFRPGVISRGVGGKRQSVPQRVSPSASTCEVGDEAILLVRHTNAPVVVCADKVKAVQCLLAESLCDVVISDDGLQHYRLGRCVEIAIVDAARRFGNQHLLPAGPLREPVRRMRTVDLAVVHGEQFTLTPVAVASLKNPNIIKSLNDFRDQKVHAVAGIGHPLRFFEMLAQAGLRVLPHAFPDHYAFDAAALAFADDLPILMTEKDAVKCAAFADDRCWYVRVAAKIEDNFSNQLLQVLKSKGVVNEYD